MTIDAIRRMELGQLVDYCETWNDIHKNPDDDDKGKPKKKVHKRKATQADWDALMG